MILRKGVEAKSLKFQAVIQVPVILISVYTGKGWIASLEDVISDTEAKTKRRWSKIRISLSTRKGKKIESKWG